MCWLILDDRTPATIESGYRAASLWIILTCGTEGMLRWFGRGDRSVVAVLCADILALISIPLVMSQWPSGDDGKGVAFLLVAGLGLVTLVAADAVVGIVAVRRAWMRRVSRSISGE